jgi:hypothetical protein
MSATELIEKYYNIKGKYTSKYEGSKSKILKSDASLYEKKTRIKKIRRQCINCKRNVGTIFGKKDGILFAKCGDVDNPCNLDIQINTGMYDNISNLLTIISDDMERAKKYIIDIKLKFLYNLISEEELEQTFNVLKENYKSLKSGYDNILTQKNLNNKVEIDDPLNKEIERTTLQKINEIKIGNLINSFKKLIQDYTNEDRALEKRSLMNDILDLYSNQLIPLFEYQRGIVYKVNTVIEDKNINYLVQIKNNLKDDEISLEEPSIVSNKK